jgi:flavorubredoxin
LTDKGEPLALARGVYWVGVIDWNRRDFHGYITPGGTTYNAYLIVDEKIGTSIDLGHKKSIKNIQ